MKVNQRATYYLYYLSVIGNVIFMLMGMATTVVIFHYMNLPNVEITALTYLKLLTSSLATAGFMIVLVRRQPRLAILYAGLATFCLVSVQFLIHVPRLDRIWWETYISPTTGPVETFLGNIVKDFPATKPDDEYRIVFITDISGRDVSQEMRWTIVESNLPNVTLYPRIHLGHITTQHIQELLFHVVDAKPDLVVLYAGLTDNSYAVTRDPRPGYPPSFARYELIDDSLNNRESLVPITALALSKIDLIHLVLKDEIAEILFSKQQNRAESSYLSDNWRAEILDNVFTNYEKACHIAQGFDFDIMVINPPTMATRNILTEDEQNRTVWFAPHYDLIVQQTPDIQARFSQLQTRFQADEHCYFVDYSSWFADTEDGIYTDPIQLRTEYAKMLSDQVLMDALDILGLEMQ